MPVGSDGTLWIKIPVNLDGIHEFPQPEANVFVRIDTYMDSLNMTDEELCLEATDNLDLDYEKFKSEISIVWEVPK